MYNKLMLPIQLTKILYQKWQGQISVSSQDSQIYGKCLNGPGKVTFKNGNKYQGQFYNGLLHGKGRFIWSNRIQYQGQFTDNRITGHGVYRWPDGSLYQGQVKDGLRHGLGKYTIQEATYEGDWIQGKKWGKGKIIFRSGSIFEGSFKNDLKEGFGKMYYYPSGNYFQGQWKNDKKQGRGTMNWTDIRQKYVGLWRNNYQEGWGMHIWLESKGQGKYIRNRYEGHWVNGVRDGYGVFYYANGSKYEGYWRDNMKQGFAFYTNENGIIQLTLFRKDRMIRGNQPGAIQESGRKVTPKKQVQVNFYSMCLRIQPFYLPFTPSLEQLYNYLLRNNTTLKSWYKGISTFYDQQSEYSFCLNLEGAWKMIRSLKILGNFSLATLNRGLYSSSPNVRELLRLVQQTPDLLVSYEDIYYQSQARNREDIRFGHPEVERQKDLAFPFQSYSVHDKDKNILFRQFVQLLVWIGFNLDPMVDKPQRSVQKIIAKISPFLQNISKMAKTGMNISEAMSDNKSSISKAEKNISPFYKALNHDLINALLGQDNEKFMGKKQMTITVKDLLYFGRLSGTFGQNQIPIFEKIIEKYSDPEVLNVERSPNWQNSALPTKVLNILNYELVQYEFSQIIYIVFVKKIGSHKQTEQNKTKYKQLYDQLAAVKSLVTGEKDKHKKYSSERRVCVSRKDQIRRTLTEKRVLMEGEKHKKEQKQRQKARQLSQLSRMARQDTDIKNQDFDEQQSQFQI